MPIRFHCAKCTSVLAIGSRKAGKNILCPKCEFSMIVPIESTIPEPQAVEKVVVGAQAGVPIERTKKESKAIATKVKPKKTKDDQPLFERPDFEELLEPKNSKPAVKNFPVPPSPKAIPTAVVTAERETDNVVVMSKKQLTLLIGVVVVLLGLAVTVGFLLGR